MPSEIIAYTHLGTFASAVATVIELLAKVYIVGAHALGTVRARRTVKNFPNPPKGESTASMSPPTLLPFWKPTSQAGTVEAQAAKIAPR